MEIEEEKLDNAREKARNYYKSIGAIYCPYLDQKISLNSAGFEHILTKSWNRGRSRADQYIRLKLLPKAMEILKKCHTLQEYNEQSMFVRQKINSRWEKNLKKVKYYVFISLLPERAIRFKIIIKQVENSAPFFYLKKVGRCFHLPGLGRLPLSGVIVTVAIAGTVAVTLAAVAVAVAG